MKKILLWLCLMAVPANASSGFMDVNNACAINTSNWLVSHGIHVKRTWSSHDFVHYRRVSRSEARLGDVAHTWRDGGGHVAPVLKRAGGVVICMNPSHHHHAWVEKVCPANATFHRIN